MIITKYELCTGCHACYNVCPMHCITMKENEEGFLYPQIDEGQCINCKQCQKICPINRKLENKNPQRKAYALYYLDERVRKNSSSGGTFSALAVQILENDGVVVGAAFSKDFRSLHHIEVTDCGELELLRGAKYLQSTIGDMFAKVKSYLRIGREVLFVGTPCQVEGLVAYLGGKPEKLLLVDFICHGVPSPSVWRKYIDAISQKFNCAIEDINFRNKDLGWKMYSFKAKFIDGKQYFSTHYENAFMRGFIYKNLFLRDSCYKCEFKKENHISDITIADCWGASKLCPELDDNKGLSMVLVHTEYGAKKISDILEKTQYKEIAFEDAITANSALVKCPERPQERDMFFSKAIQGDNILKLLQKHCGLSIVQRCKHTVTKIKLGKIK